MNWEVRPQIYEYMVYNWLTILFLGWLTEQELAKISTISL